MSVDLSRAKEGFMRLFPAGHPAREAILAQPDSVGEEDFARLFPILVRLAGVKLG